MKNRMRGFWPKSFAIFGLVTIAVLLFSCSSEQTSTQKATSHKNKAIAYGNVNKVTLVADQEILDSHVGDSISFYYEQPYPLMPTPEALYDLNIISIGELKQIKARRELRVYLFIADLNDLSSPTTQFVINDLGEEKVEAATNNYKKGTSIVSNRWANDQILIYLFAKGHDNLSKLIVESFEAVQERISKADLKKLKANIYQSGISSVYPDTLKQFLKLDLSVPQDYKIALAKENLVWLRRDIGEVAQNILMTSEPYTSSKQLDIDSLIHYRDVLGQLVVRSTTEGSYMKTNTKDLKILSFERDLNGHYAKEIRGVWEMTDDFMGGPFFSYAIPDTANRRLIFIDAFTYAPSKKKRDYMQQLEHIVSSLKF